MSQNFLEGFKVGFAIMEGRNDREARETIYGIDDSLQSTLEEVRRGALDANGALERMEQDMGSYTAALARMETEPEEARVQIERFNSRFNQVGEVLTNRIATMWGTPGVESTIAALFEMHNSNMQADVQPDGQGGYVMIPRDPSGEPLGPAQQITQDNLTTMNQTFAQGAYNAAAGQEDILATRAQADQALASGENLRASAGRTAAETEAGIPAAQARNISADAAVQERALEVDAPGAAADLNRANARRQTVEADLAPAALTIDQQRANIAQQLADIQAMDQQTKQQLADQDRIKILVDIAQSLNNPATAEIDMQDFDIFVSRDQVLQRAIGNDNQMAAIMQTVADLMRRNPGMSTAEATAAVSQIVSERGLQ